MHSGKMNRSRLAMRAMLAALGAGMLGAIEVK